MLPSRKHSGKLEVGTQNIFPAKCRNRTNARSECARVSESDRECQMSAISAMGSLHRQASGKPPAKPVNFCSDGLSRVFERLDRSPAMLRNQHQMPEVQMPEAEVPSRLACRCQLCLLVVFEYMSIPDETLRASEWKSTLRIFRARALQMVFS